MTGLFKEAQSAGIISAMDAELLARGFSQEEVDIIHLRAAETSVPYTDNPDLPEDIRISHAVHPYFTEAAKAVRRKGLHVRHGIIGTDAWFVVSSPSSYRDLIAVCGYQANVLTIKRKWFDMILDGIKYEEYRDDTPYWQTRLLDVWEDGGKKLRVVFRNGYDMRSPAFLADVTAYRRTGGDPGWGAEAGKPYIVLSIDDVLIAEDGRLRSIVKEEG